MYADKVLKAAVNRIAQKHSGYRLPSEVVKFYDELEEIGVTTDLIMNRRDFYEAGTWTGDCPWYYHGVEVEESLFVMSVYEGGNSDKNDYNFYFS